jgi:hypothetical protein
MPVAWFGGRWQCVKCAAMVRAESLPDLLASIVERLVSDASP